VPTIDQGHRHEDRLLRRPRGTAHHQWRRAGADRPASVDPLFAALGGRPGIAGLVDDLVPRLAADPRIGPSFKDTNMRELNKQLGDQLCVVAGGPCRYEGGSMKEAHVALRIDKADFNHLVELLQDAMDARAIPFADQNRLLARLPPMPRDVITVR